MSNVMKCWMSWNVKCHEMSNVMKCRMSWNIKYLEMSNVMKCQMSWNVRCHEMSNIMRRQMSCCTNPHKKKLFFWFGCSNPHFWAPELGHFWPILPKVPISRCQQIYIPQHCAQRAHRNSNMGPIIYFVTKKAKKQGNWAIMQSRVFTPFLLRFWKWTMKSERFSNAVIHFGHSIWNTEN